MRFSPVVRAVGESKHRVHAICKRYVERALAGIDLLGAASAASARLPTSAETSRSSPTNRRRSPARGLHRQCALLRMRNCASRVVRDLRRHGCGSRRAFVPRFGDRGIRDDVPPARMVVTAWRAGYVPECLFFIGKLSPLCAPFGCNICSNLITAMCSVLPTTIPRTARQLWIGSR